MGVVSSSIVLLVSVVGLNPLEDVACDRVDLIEINHFYDEQGRLVFDQVIFYDWSSSESHFHVCAWRLLKNPTQIPHRDWQNKEYISVWHDGEILREVRSETIRESWTQYDPELLERQRLPKEKRRELRKLLIKQVSNK